MSVPLANYTLTYNESVQGWPSFYSFAPEFIKGMNQYLYTFKGGNLYRHNVNESRNTFYGLSPAATTITTVLNTDALTTKLFKTIDIESQDPWEVSLYSDIQGARTIDVDWFQKKEGDWFAFIRGLTDDSDNFSMRSAKGIGIPATLNTAGTLVTITYNFRVTTPIQVGDTVYATPVPASVAPARAGNITAVTLGAATTSITFDTNTYTAPIVTDFIFYVRNQVAESQGLLGHYAVITLENNLSTATEMMAVKVDLMKSYP
jgi:hypothetical protein